MGRALWTAEEIVDRLEALLGPAPDITRGDATDELVACILSQNTSDINSYRAFDALKHAFPSWEQVLEVPAETLAQVIWRGGMANQKAKSIQNCLREVQSRTGGLTLDFLKEVPPLEARDWLMSLPGVGPKTASLVLCFSFEVPLIPVDTHVFRVASRLGLVEEKKGANAAHDSLLTFVPPGLAYRFHMALINHGRGFCKPQRPKCELCPLLEKCPGAAS